MPDRPPTRPPAPSWQRCQPGQFTDLAERLRHRRQRRLFLKQAGVLALAGAGGGAAALCAALVHSLTSRATQFAGLTCVEVQQILRAHQGAGLGGCQCEQVRQHLSCCQACQQLARQLDVRL